MLLKVMAAAGAAAVLLSATVPTALRAQEPVRVMSLDEVVSAALERDPSAVAAENAVANARTNRLQAAGSWLPSLNLNGSYANSSNERFDQATGRLVSENYAAQVQGGYDIFTGGRRIMNMRAANAQLTAADAQYDAQRFSTILVATETFYAAAAATAIVAAAEQRLARARDQFEAARTRLELGTATQSDALRAELELGNAEGALLDARSAMRNATLELGRRVGVAAQVRPADAALPDSAPPLPPLDVLVRQATAGSPAVLAAEANLVSSRTERLAAYTPYLPTLRLTGGYDWSAFSFPPQDRSWSMRMTASLPLFNNFQREAAVQRAAAAVRVAEARARDAAIAARVAIESAAAEIESAELRITLADRGLALAREDLRVQEERYQMSVATILELQTSQVALSEAEVTAVRARQTLGAAVAQLEAILGQRLGDDR